MSITAAAGNDLSAAPVTPPATLRADLERQREFRVDQLQRLAIAAARQITQTTAQPGSSVIGLLRDAARAALTEIDAALDRMARNCYGLCQQCGSAIPLERLRVLPMAAMCMPCQYAHELALTERSPDTTPLDIVDVWGRGSFPASDPPSNW
jgi:RNA polymerase-binding transcription factor DksA